MAASEMQAVYRDVDRSLSDPRNRKKFIGMCRQWFDKNGEIMTDTGLAGRPYFPISLEDDMMVVLGVTKVAIKNARERSPAAKTQTFALTQSEFAMTLVLAIRFFLKKKAELECRTTYMLLVYRHYSMLHKRFFMHGVDSKEAMDYMVNNLSMKNDLKKLGSLQAALEKMASNCHSTYEKGLADGNDEDVFKYSINMWTRTNSFVRSYAKQYYDIYKKKLYLNVDDTSSEEEGDYRPERRSDSAGVANLARSAYMHAAAASPNERILSVAANGNEISVNLLRATVEGVRRKGDQGVEEIFRGILELMSTERADPGFKAICSKSYLRYVLGIYSRSNTNDATVLSIKSVLDKILKEGCPRYVETNREATRVSYRRALFLYYTLVLQVHRCQG